ncbi:ATP-NAD kinase [Dichomitus squalens]|uniref:ATP-NAD kinase n=2 Tax=Dichomitus squalens TaxID=114155 RepID=A0A4V2K6V8_9APHY|nr:ATP-NAD kinase [Dichomitus squalens LYAD-421 SS1]EJF58213.1 ATP-NAD kinase [Dichomitus squalens LYAD-421 SS1]TBU30224.1 ATP-NAD kinase [Dichomitus squalens]TBU38784.1 ATP-NAD kinase [Dichomitus squalens]TBU53763.1 ATP-NAD kinase [Dichomitus squalens]
MSWLNSTHPNHDHEPRSKEDRHASYADGTVSDSYSETTSPYADEDEREYAQSLTKQLADTAVTVREWSKKLGRTRVRSHIQSVLIVTKARDNRLIKLTRELALYLMQKKRGTDRGMIVYVDAQLKTSRRFDAAGLAREHPELFVPFPKRRNSSNSSLLNGFSNGSSEGPSQPEGQLRYWTAEMCSKSPHLFDFVVTLGGDGTVLFTSWLFQRIVPPVLPFALGSLGFLTNFDFANHQKVMDSAIDDGVRVNLRMRFTCTVYRAISPDKNSKAHRAIKKGDTGEIFMRNVEQDGWEALESGNTSTGRPHGKDKEIMCFSTKPVECFEVLNDLVVDRGPSPYVSLLELFGDEHHLTTVQADGLCVATPTGSTAYSLSAGGSLVHPEIPAILITPLCPHTLSFRPMLLPDTMELRICVPFNSRSTAWASFDGRGRVELKQGDHIKVTASKYPFPTVCAESQSRDWFHSISRTLKWNERERQKSFVVVEEEPGKSRKSSREGKVRDATPTAKRHEEAAKKPEEENEDELDEEDEVSEEEEEKYDIDDLSSTESPSSVSVVSMQLSPEEAKIGQEKLHDDDNVQAEAEDAVRRLAKGDPYLSSTLTSAPSSGLKSGIDTPDRFAGGQQHPHPPRVSPRHVQFLTSSASSSSSSVATFADEYRRGDRGERDDIHSPRSAHHSTRVRIPRDRDLDAENLRTPTPAEQGHRPSFTRSRSRSREPPRRAFAVWGHDESDSAASDSDADT